MFYTFLFYFNWVVVGLLGALWLADRFAPGKGGGDAAGQAMGKALAQLANIALVVLLVLNLIPGRPTKYIAFFLVIVPLVWFGLIGPYLGKWIRRLSTLFEARQPVFKDKALNRLAQAIRYADEKKFKALMQTPPAHLREGGELLAFAIGEANYTTYKPDEKTELVRQLFDAGCRLEDIPEQEVPIHFAAASSSNAPLLQLLLDKGADPNAVQPFFGNRPIIFEALSGYRDPEGSVRALLEHGADPNALTVLDDRVGAVSPLFDAAHKGRWGVCAVLLEYGADPDFALTEDISYRHFVEKAKNGFSENGYSIREDFERMLERLERKGK